MDDQLNDGSARGVAPGQELPIDPLRRAFVPIEKRNVLGQLGFRTSDREAYIRYEDGSIHRKVPKVRGKSARKADRVRRREKQT